MRTMWRPVRRFAIALAALPLAATLGTAPANAGPLVVVDDGGSQVAPAAPTLRVTTTLAPDAATATGWRTVAVADTAPRLEDVRGGRVLTRTITPMGTTNAFVITRGRTSVTIPNRYRREAYAPRLQPGAAAVLYLRYPSDTSVSLTRSDAVASRSLLTQNRPLSETRAYSPPAVSGDGRTAYWLRATCVEAGPCRHAVTLYRISLVDGTVTAAPVTGAPRYAELNELRLSPDGRRLLVVGSPELTDGDTVPARPYLVPVTGGAAKVLPIVVRDATWSDDGAWLVAVLPVADVARAYQRRTRVPLVRYSPSRNRLLPVAGSGTLRTWTFGVTLVP